MFHFFCELERELRVGLRFDRVPHAQPKARQIDRAHRLAAEIVHRPKQLRRPLELVNGAVEDADTAGNQPDVQDCDCQALTLADRFEDRRSREVLLAGFVVTAKPRQGGRGTRQGIGLAFGVAQRDVQLAGRFRQCHAAAEVVQHQRGAGGSEERVGDEPRVPLRLG